MATSAVSSTSSATSTATASSTSAIDAAAAAIKANKANAQKILTSLGAGSGVDVNALAQSLVDAEKIPRQNEINTKITKNDNKVSGYAAINFALNSLSDAFKGLKDQSGFTGVSANNSNPSAFSVTATGLAQVGDHDIEVISTAKPQRSLSAGFLSAGYPLNSGNAMTAKITLAAGISIDVPVAAGKDNPTGVVAAINAMTAKSGISASVVNTGDKGQAPVTSQTELAGPLLAPSSYGVFSAQIGTTPFSVNTANLSPAPTNMTELAAALQQQLQAQDTTSLNNNITVSVSASGGLLISDARGRAISGMTLKKVDGSDGASGTVVAAGALGVSAKPFKIMLTGPTGAAQGFSIDFKTASPTVVNRAGTASSTETSDVNFTALTTGQSVTVGGLTYTATAAVSANQVAAAFANLAANAITGSGTATGTYSGTLTGFSSGAVSSGVVTFTSTTTNTDVTNLAVTSSAQPTAITSISFSGPPLQSASDASVNVDGINYIRSTNSIKDVLTGVTLDLKSPTPVGSPALLNLARDTTPVKDKITALVTAYNDANSILNVVSDPKSTVDQFGASLVGDSTVSRIREQIRSMVTGVSTTPSANGFKQIWQFGVTLTQTGQLEVDTTKLEASLQSNFDDAVTMFTGNTDNLSNLSTQPSGLSGAAFKKLTDLTSKTGYIQAQSDSATKQNTKYKEDLTVLDTRMQTLLDRYTKQFATMNSLVGQTNTLKTSLKSTFDGMMATYTNK